MERAPPAYMGRPRRKLPSPGRQWFVARRFPTLAARSFQPPLHWFPVVIRVPTRSPCYPKSGNRARLRPECHSGNEAQGREVVPSEFIVARCDAPEVLEPAVAALDDVAILIGLLVVTYAFLPI